MRFHSFVRFGLVSLLSALPIVSYGQFQPPTKEELSMTSDPKAPGVAAVYLNREEVADDPHHFRTVYARIKVLTEAGKEMATVQVTYQRNFIFNASGNNSSRMGSGSAGHWDAPDVNHAGEDHPMDADSFNVRTEVTAIEGRTIHSDGTIVPLSGTPADLLRVKKGRNQVNDISFNLPSVEVGSILEYRYQVRYDRFEQAPDWQVQQPIFVHKAHYAFTPAEKFLPARNKMGGAGVDDSALTDIHGEQMTDIRSAAVLPPGGGVKQEATGRYTLDLTDIPPIPQQAFQPALSGQVYQVSFFYTPTPDLKEFWQKEMGYWTKAVNQYTSSTSPLQNALAEIISPSDSQLEKAKKIFANVQKLDNIDFTEDGEPGIFSDWIPNGHVDKVMEERKGTSNQVAFLYLALLRTAGLSARPERIASRSHRIFSPAFLRTDQLDSVVIAVNIDGKEITVDPGTKMAPFETMHWAHAGAGGVAMGASGKVEVIITPLQQNTDNSLLRVGSLIVSPQGAVSGTLKVAFLGQQAIQLRQLALKSGPDIVKEEINNFLARQVPNGVQAKVDHIAYLDDTSKQLLVVVPVSGSLATPTGSRLILPRLFFESRESNPFPVEENRTLPVDVRYPSQEQEQITYVLPAGFAVEGTPEDAKLTFENNAAYQLKTKIDGGSITNARMLARGFTLLESKDYGQLRDFYQKVVSTDQQQLVLTAARPAGQ
jgi:Domain of Unknown Function with PDB structure (DUF3857)/Transglutaminase-like superfamily